MTGKIGLDANLSCGKTLHITSNPMNYSVDYDASGALHEEPLEVFCSTSPQLSSLPIYTLSTKWNQKRNLLLSV